jgi:hypothetical protein
MFWVLRDTEWIKVEIGLEVDVLMWIWCSLIAEVFRYGNFFTWSLFHNHPINSSQAKQINEKLKQKEEKERKDAWRIKKIKKRFVGTTWRRQHERSISFHDKANWFSLHTWLICGDLNKERIDKAYGNKSPHWNHHLPSYPNIYFMFNIFLN